jgi:anti-sigma regulatory factor (Ser/Thr protein kinase)
MALPVRYHFEREARVESLAELRAFVQHACAAHAIDEERSFALRLAADEAVTNIITHGYAGQPTGFYQVDLDMGAEQVTLVISDQGRAFDPQGAPQPNLTADAEQRTPGGLGLYLIHQLIDVVRYESAEGTNRLTLIKRCGMTADGRTREISRKRGN